MRATNKTIRKHIPAAYFIRQKMPKREKGAQRGVVNKFPFNEVKWEGRNKSADFFLNE